MNNDINVVIGSWGSYNACNEKALGSSWICLNDYFEWENIEEELVKQGFKLNGIDEELFIQDIEGLDCDLNWDTVHPQQLFQTLKDSGVLDNSYKYEVMDAYLQVRDFSDFEARVNSYGEDWDTDIYIHKNCDWYDFGQEYFESCGYSLPNGLENFIDFEAYGRHIGDYYAQEYNNGIIEIF